MRPADPPPSSPRGALLAGLALLGMLLGACGGAPARDASPARGYELFPMYPQYRGEEHGQGAHGTVVRYLTDEERAGHLLHVRDGLLVDVEGRPLDPDLANHPHRNGFAMYVLAPDGRVYYTFDHVQGAFHHSSLLAGAPVAAAGDMTILDGRLLEISNSSGHYRPPPRSLDQILDRLREMGVELEGVKVTVLGDDPPSPEGH